MSDIFIKSESRYPVNKKKIKEKVKEILVQAKIKDEVELSVVIVGDRKMKNLNKKYREKKHTTPVLAFPLENSEARKKFPLPFSSPDNTLRLGDVLISFPQARKMASNEEKMIDEKINELVEHGMEKLLGIGS